MNMAYQRTEYADKTLSMNSLADRKLKLKLGSIESHKGTIEKEMQREKKKLERELGSGDENLRSRLAVMDLGDSSRSLSPRLPRRYSTPPELLSASLPPPITDPRRSPVATRRRIVSEGLNDPLSCDPSCGSNPSLLSPTSMFLKAPFDQPRRQSLPPIGDGGLLRAENAQRRDRRGSYGGGVKTPVLTPSPNISGASTPRGLSRKGSSLNEAQMNEITAKVSKFLQKMDNKNQNEKNNEENNQHSAERTEHDLEKQFDSCEQEFLPQPLKTPPPAGLFQPLNFE